MDLAVNCQYNVIWLSPRFQAEATLTSFAPPLETARSLKVLGGRPHYRRPASHIANDTGETHTKFVKGFTRWEALAPRTRRSIQRKNRPFDPYRVHFIGTTAGTVGWRQPYPGRPTRSRAAAGHSRPHWSRHSRHRRKLGE